MTIFKLEGASNMSGFRKSLIAVTATAVVVALAPAEARAQGCVASRIEAPSGPTDPEGASYFLAKGKWQANVGFQGYRSHRHFVGSVEQNIANTAKGTAERAREGTEVINHVYQPGIAISYGLTDRLSITADQPYFRAVRRSPVGGNRPSFATDSAGLSDLTLTSRYWLGNPEKHTHGNVSVGFGFKLPTGADKVEDDFLVSVDPSTGARKFERRPVDQSVQPADGGFGLIAEVTAFKAFGKVVAFASGQYLANPREQNSFLRNPLDTNPDPVTGRLSVADQYSARLGLGTSFNKLGVSLATRLQGVPSSDLIGGDLGRRRPGYSWAIEPGLSYSFKRSALSLSVPVLFYRNRTQALADKLESKETGKFENGDAAYADYVVIGSYNIRF
jgi:hypothetical protein